MYLLLLFSPLFNFLILILFGRFFGKKGLAFIVSSFFTFFFFLSCDLFLRQFFNQDVVYLKLFNWVSCFDVLIEYEFLFDSLSLIMIFLVSSISTVVNVYSLDYMEKDSHIIRFFSYLSLFTFFMIVLITASNLILLIVGWEGVGICSYLLISFWFTRNSACKAGIKAIILNRIADCGLFLAVSIIFFFTKTANYQMLFSILPHMFLNTFFLDFYLLDFIMIFLVIGAMGKSAQIGLHIWLADAMEGPTPVSALIHAATMVTAGVYLLIRFSFILEYTFVTSKVVVFVGMLTTFLASTAGLVQNDLKKIIAYSTCSQLGYMISVCGVSGYNFALFHLITHGFFKALLFLSAGLIIHGFLEEQDIRKMGGLFYTFPLTYSFFFIGSLCLLGFPFLSGFYSKDFLLEYFIVFPSYSSMFIYHLGTFSAMLTSFYSFRLFFLVFLTKPRGFIKSYTKNIGDFFDPSYLILTLLAFISIFVGYFLQELFIGFGSNYFFSSIFIKDLFFIKPTAISVDYYLLNNSFSLFKVIPFFYSIIGFFLAFFFFQKSANYLTFTRFYKFLYTFFYQAWFINYLFLTFISNSFFKLCNLFFKLDKSFIENLGPEGMKKLVLTNPLFIRVCFKDWSNLSVYLFYLFYLAWLSLFFYLLEIFFF